MRTPRFSNGVRELINEEGGVKRRWPFAIDSRLLAIRHRRLAFGLFSGNLRRLKFLSSTIARLLPAILAGLLMAAAFPKPGIAGLAWVAPGVLLFAAIGQTGRRRFLIGYVGGFTFYLSSLYWLLFIPFPAGAFAGWLALSAYLALYPAVWVWLCWKLFPASTQTSEIRTPEPQPAEAAVSIADLPWLRSFLETTWWKRALWALLCATVWVALELTVGRFLTGFPWLFLGVSQYRVLPVIQIASATGVYGVSFLVVWFSVSLMIVLLRLARLPQNRWSWMAELRVPLVGLLAVAVSGVTRILSQQPADRELTLALVQPSIRQELLWDRREDAARFEKIMNLSRLALATKPDLLVWPESAMPAFTEENLRAITNMIATNKVWMVFGADDAERHPTARAPGNYDFFNSAFLFNSSGQYTANYRKQRLVIFGEYVPLTGWLPFLKHLTPIEGGFTPGAGPVPFKISEPRATFSVLICFEDVFGQLARRYVNDDTDFLLNLTNDGWFGQSAAQWQQAANATFRAIENGVPLVRCTNNGLTCWIDAHGRMVQICQSSDGDVYAAGFLMARVQLPPAGQRSTPTIYRRYGDWFAWGCFFVSIFFAVQCVMEKHRSK